MCCVAVSAPVELRARLLRGTLTEAGQDGIAVVSGSTKSRGLLLAFYRVSLVF